jgi:hypothetical protein
VDGHIPALSCVVAIGEELAHEVLQCETSLLEYTSFAVLCEDYIVLCQGCGGSNCDSFLASGNL